METTIYKLPDEVLARIFTHLDNKSFWSRINLVTRAWNSIWNNNILVKKRKTVDTRICIKRKSLKKFNEKNKCINMDICDNKFACIINFNEADNPYIDRTMVFYGILNNTCEFKYSLIEIYMMNHQYDSIKLYPNYVALETYGRFDICTTTTMTSPIKSYIKFDHREKYFICDNNKLLYCTDKDTLCLYSDFNKTNMIFKLENIYVPILRFDNANKLIYIADEYYFKVIDYNGNIKFKNRYDIDIKKIDIKDDKIYLFGDKYSKNVDIYKDKYDCNRIYVLDINKYNYITEHVIFSMDVNYICIVKNLIITKKCDQLEVKSKMIVYDMHDKEIVKKINIKPTYEWTAYDHTSICDFGSVINYENKIIIADKNGLLYFKLR